MNTIQLECFLSVAEHLNFSRASEELKITQPAVSHQIRTLEEELSVKLFQRTSKNVSLTPEGIQFLPDAELILKTAVSAKKRLGRHENFIPFEIGCHNYMELTLLPPILQKLAEEFPQLRPNMRIVPFPSLQGLVENQKLHGAFGIKDAQKKTSLLFRELCSAPIACVCYPGHPLSQRKSLTRKDLEGSMVACSPGQISDPVFSAQSSVISQLLTQHHYFTESIESAFTLVKARLGCTLYPDVPALRDPQLCYIPMEDFPPLPFGIFYRYDNDHPALKRFLRLFQEIFPSL